MKKIMVTVSKAHEQNKSSRKVSSEPVDNVYGCFLREIQEDVEEEGEEDFVDISIPNNYLGEDIVNKVDADQDGDSDRSRSTSTESYDGGWKTDSCSSIDSNPIKCSIEAGGHASLDRKRNLKCKSWHSETKYSVKKQERNMYLRTNYLDVESSYLDEGYQKESSLYMEGRERSYSQRYDICSSPVLSEICSPRIRAKTFTADGHNDSSPSTRRRRISVKSSHIRKQSCRAAPPRIRKRTLSSGSSPALSRKENSSPRFQTERPQSSLSEVVIPSRRLSVAVSRKPSNTLQRRPVRRCSEPFLLDPVTLQNKWNSRKHSTSRNFVRRRLSSAGSNLPSSSKHKLQALAKDELLASLNVPLSGGVISPVVDITEPESKVAQHQSSEEDVIEKEKSRRETKRLMIMEEILETEKNYISCLETLNEVFRNQLHGSNIITEKDLHSLFPSHLNDIKTSHSWFMNELEERMKNENWRGIIGDIFAKMTSASSNLLEMYTAYVNAFPKSISTLSKCTRSSQKFRKFLEDCYENPVVERLDLPSFLLSPVQRLPRYILLLRELSKYTDEEHPDKYFISEAMKEMEALISSLNSSIHSSMEFYSASDSRRKKMTRQFTSKKRKQRTSSALQKVSSKKNSVMSESRTSTEPDQGYCSFGEPRDESPEDEQVPTRKARASTWRGGKRSMSMISAGSDDGKNGVVIRRKNDSVIGRNADSRKSWRRSLGAVFSQLWSKEEVLQANINNNNNNGNGKLRSTPSLIVEDIDIKSDNDENHNATDGSSEGGFKRKSSMARRKIAIVHTPPTNEDEKVNDLNDMVRDASLDDETLSSPTSLDFPVITSSVDGLHRRNSTESEKSSTSLRTPNSPQYFKRGKLRGSAGPVFKSIFQRNNSQKIKKTLSWDELNVTEHDEEKRQKRFSFRKNTRQASSKEQLNLTSSVSESRISHSYKVSNKDSISISSEDTVSSQASTHCSLKEEDSCPDNNNITYKTNKKNKFMKTLKNIVGKK